MDPTLPEIMNVFGFTYVFSSMSAQEGRSSEEGQVIQNVLEKIKKGTEQLQSLFSKCEMKNEIKA